MGIINNTKLDKELRSAAIPINGVGTNTDGTTRIDFNNATQAQRDQAAAILAAHDPRDYDLEKQQAALGELKALTLLAGKTDAQISAYIDSLTIADPVAKQVIKLLARAAGALARDRGIA